MVKPMSSDKREPHPIPQEQRPLAPEEELPVVARLAVELRSDGRRIIATGALEDLALGQRVALKIKGASLLDFSAALVRALLGVPTFAAGTARRLLSGNKK